MAVGLLSLDVETRGLPPLAPPPRVCGEVYLTLPYLTSEHMSLRKREKADRKQNENTTRTLSHGQAILRQRLWGLQSAACDAFLTSTASTALYTVYILYTLPQLCVSASQWTVRASRSPVPSEGFERITRAVLDFRKRTGSAEIIRTIYIYV